MLNIRQNRNSDGPCLWICSTPIGNLQDVTFRLLDTLRSADIVAAEDTRQTLKLLNHFEIRANQLVSYHQHNQQRRIQDFVQWWGEGKTIAVVSDAGTPGISDPGDTAITAALDCGIPVIPIPGASAVLSALVASGLPMQPFSFIGFLPRAKDEAGVVLSQFSRVPSTLVLYEAPHRLQKTLKLINEIFPKRRVCLARELTKRYETFMNGTATELVAHFETNEARGEFVVMIGPPDPSEQAQSEVTPEAALENGIRLVEQWMSQGISHKQAVTDAVAKTGARKKDLYQATLPT